jgi:hypothetical protein
MPRVLFKQVKVYLNQDKKRPKTRMTTYELVYPVTVSRIRAGLVIADNIATDRLVVVVVVIVVGVRTRNNHASVRALGCQTWARFLRTVAITLAAIDGTRWGGRNELVLVEWHCRVAHHLSPIRTGYPRRNEGWVRLKSRKGTVGVLVRNQLGPRGTTPVTPCLADRPIAE